MALRSIPKNLRGLRACLVCSMIKTMEQFFCDGCDNCEKYIGMKGNRDIVCECTSSNFDGMISFMGGEDSWVGKWQRIGDKTKGIYAISVSGQLPKWVIRELKASGYVYKSRDNRIR